MRRTQQVQGRVDSDVSTDGPVEKNGGDYSKTAMKGSVSTPARRKPLFEYPALPFPETVLCFVIATGGAMYGWWCTWSASQRYEFKMGSAASYQELPFGLGPRLRDELNWEWLRWSPLALYYYLPALIAHSLVFNFSRPLLRLSERQWVHLCLVVWVFLAAWVWTWKLVALTLVQAVLIFTVTWYCRKKWMVWLSSLPCLYLMMAHPYLLTDDIFLVLLFSAYTQLSLISFCLDWCEGKTRLEDSTPRKLFTRMLFYTFYQPYLISLIVLYADFERQMAVREARGGCLDWWRVVWKGARIAFWWVLIEVGLCYLYFESMLADVEWAMALPKDEFVSLGMAMGAFFFLKYVVIFGLPSLFAQIDGLEPPVGPICISRVSLYSKIWRGFDRGLYGFFKEYLFLPICRPSFSVGRKVAGVAVSYLFVLFWHGFHHHNIVWIVLNVVELMLEYGSKAIYSIEGVRRFRESQLSDVNFRRLLAVLHIVPFAFGLYSNFYFLGGSLVGQMFVQRIFWEETVPVRWPFLLLITIGYFYMHMAMEVDRWQGAKGEGAKGGKCPLGAMKDEKTDGDEEKKKEL